MGSHARNLIDAVQHTMLDRLVLRLLPLLWLTTLGDLGADAAATPAWRNAVLDGALGKRTDP